MRLNKYIASSGYCSRRKADTLIESGKVTINGHTASLGDQAEEGDVVKIDGTMVTTEGKTDIFLAFHKPVGVISTLDPNAENSVLDYIPGDDRVFYIGRLDVASSGLMLLTNNGDVANKLTRSEENHEKEYVVTVDKKLTRSAIDAMRHGIKIMGRKTKPARVKKLSDAKFNIVLTEGRNQQIRRMCKVLGYEVKKLRRIRVANVKLGDLGEGNWRQLTKNERRTLLESVGQSPHRRSRCNPQ